MSSLIPVLLASAQSFPSVPDAGSSGLLFGLGILCLGIVARFVKNRRQ